MSIRISSDPRPLAWTTVSVTIDGEQQSFRARLHLLDPRTAAAYQAERLRLARAVQTGEQGEAADLLLVQFEPQHIDGLIDTLLARVLDWDLLDEAGEPLPVTPERLRAVVENPVFFRPLWDALLSASLDGPRGNA